MKSIMTISLSLLLTFCALFSNAQIIDDCAQVLLVKNTKITSKTYSQDIAVLDMVNRNNYDEVKRSVKTSATVFFSGATGLFSGNYDEFEKKREEFKRLYEYKSSEASAESEFVRTLPTGALKTYLECKKTLASKRGGIILTPVSVDGNNITVNLSWVHPNGLDGKMNAPIITGGTLIGPKLSGVTFKSGNNTNFTFRRNRGQPFSLTVNESSKGFSETLKLEKFTPLTCQTGCIIKADRIPIGDIALQKRCQPEGCTAVIYYSTSASLKFKLPGETEGDIVQATLFIRAARNNPTTIEVGKNIARYCFTITVNGEDIRSNSKTRIPAHSPDASSPLDYETISFKLDNNQLNYLKSGLNDIDIKVECTGDVDYPEMKGNWKGYVLIKDAELRLRYER